MTFYLKMRKERYILLGLKLVFAVNLLGMDQIPFVQYEAVPNYQVTPQGGLESIPTDPFLQKNNNNGKRNSYPVIGGYYIDSKYNLKRIKIQINEVSNSFGGGSIYLRGTYNNTYSVWIPCNTPASKVDSYMDGEFLTNNFEWKVDNAIYGTIYFNY